MNPELRTLLLEIGFGAVVGLIVGGFIARFRPGWCKAWKKFCLNGQWKLFTFGAVLFGAGGILDLVHGNPYRAALAFALCGLEIFALLRYGLKPLTPEQVKAIDESDPAENWLWKPLKRS